MTNCIWLCPECYLHYTTPGSSKIYCAKTLKFMGIVSECDDFVDIPKQYGSNNILWAKKFKEIEEFCLEVLGLNDYDCENSGTKVALKILRLINRDE